MGASQSFRQLCDREKNTNIRLSLPAVCIVWQLAMIILFGVFIRYNHESDAHWVEYRKQHNLTDIENDFYFRYPSKWLRYFYLFYSSNLSIMPPRLCTFVLYLPANCLLLCSKKLLLELPICVDLTNYSHAADKDLTPAGGYFPLGLTPVRLLPI